MEPILASNKSQRDTVKLLSRQGKRKGESKENTQKSTKRGDPAQSLVESKKNGYFNHQGKQTQSSNKRFSAGEKTDPSNDSVNLKRESSAYQSLSSLRENVDSKLMRLQQSRQSHQLITPKLQTVGHKDTIRPASTKQKKEEMAPLHLRTSPSPPKDASKVQLQSPQVQAFQFLSKPLVGSQTPQANNVNIQKLIHDYKQKLNIAVKKEDKD